MTAPRVRLGAPGVYRSPQRTEPSFQPVRLDVGGFVGVALRGPVNSCTLVTSWSDYQRIFGGYERPDGGPDRFLPYAVAAFFAQGGVRAFVVRVAPADDSAGTADDATSRYQLGGLDLAAANEGSWGDRLSIELDYVVAQAFTSTVRQTGELAIPSGTTLPPGTLLRLRGMGMAAAGEFRWVTGTGRDGIGRPFAILDRAAGEPDAELGAVVITATVNIRDGDPDFVRTEAISGLGLYPTHPRFLPTTLDRESELVAVSSAPSGPLVPDRPQILPVLATRTHDGLDRWRAITGTSFFDDGPADDDPADELPHRGADLLGREPEVGILTVPDLLWEWHGSASVVPDPTTRPTADFVRCDAPAATIGYIAAPAPPALLDPRDPSELQEIVSRQARLVSIADLRRRFVVLLDVPPGLPLADITRWRAWFDTSYAAGYHPWMDVVRGRTAGDVSADTTVHAPASVFAAGIIAARERRLGLSWGPANELATGAVAAVDDITDAEHDQLHLLGVNVFRNERDGFRLTAARTLSSNPDYRQLSVRRLMTMLALTLDRQSQWLVFEPNTPDLRAQLTHTIVELLRGLFRAGAFAGDTEQESFFVLCDDGLNPPQSQEQGRLIAEVGVAPANPLEYLVLRVSQDTDGRVRVEAANV